MRPPSRVAMSSRDAHSAGDVPPRSAAQGERRRRAVPRVAETDRSQASPRRAETGDPDSTFANHANALCIAGGVGLTCLLQIAAVNACRDGDQLLCHATADEVGGAARQASGSALRIHRLVFSTGKPR